MCGAGARLPQRRTEERDTPAWRTPCKTPGKYCENIITVRAFTVLHLVAAVRTQPASLSSFVNRGAAQDIDKAVTSGDGRELTFNPYPSKGSRTAEKLFMSVKTSSPSSATLG